MTSPLLSIVIPTLNESRALPATLRQLFGQSGNYEVILADGGSTDDTVAIARTWSDVKVVMAEQGRASQMNVGAAAATGDLLVFLHADTLLPDGAAELLARHCDDADFQWGGFHQQFSGNTWALRSISSLHNMRCRLSKIFYGDQTMFVRRELFNTVDGFPDVDILEDVLLSERLLQEVQPAFLSESVITDSRKFEQMGSIASLLRCVLIIISNELRLPILGRRFFTAIR